MVRELGEQGTSGTLIELPRERNHQVLLRTKLQQYNDWAGDEQQRYRAPEQRTTSRDYARRALSALLGTGEVDTYDLCRKLEQEQGGLFDLSEFNAGLAVIDEYTKNKSFLQERVKAGR